MAAMMPMKRTPATAGLDLYMAQIFHDIMTSEAGDQCDESHSVHNASLPVHRRFSIRVMP